MSLAKYKQVNKQEKCILVVDDSTDNLYLMQLILENQGYKVGTADSGKIALERVKKCQPDLIFLDVMMPTMNGYEVVHQLREDQNLPLIPIYFVTADKYTNYQEAIAAGANGVIYKPIEIDQLLSQVAHTLGASK
ncbi:MAG: response regulator [Pleurocapsa sp.]